MIDDATLVRRAKRDSAEFIHLYDRYIDRIYAWAVREMGDEATAQDVVAATFEKALVQLPKLREPEKVRGWLYAIARNEARRRFNQGKRLDVLDERLPGDLNVEAAVNGRVEFGRILHALHTLSDRDQEVLRLHYFEELRHPEIAVVLNCSPRNVAVRLHRALGRLRPRRPVHPCGGQPMTRNNHDPNLEQLGEELRAARPLDHAVPEDFRRQLRYRLEDAAAQNRTPRFTFGGFSATGFALAAILAVSLVAWGVFRPNSTPTLSPETTTIAQTEPTATATQTPISTPVTILQPTPPAQPTTTPAAHFVDERLINRRWVWLRTELADGTEFVPDTIGEVAGDELPILSFSDQAALDSADNHLLLGSFVGCNQMTGSYIVATDGSIRADLNLTTQAICPNKMEAEEFWQANFFAFERYEIFGNALRLFRANGDTFVFVTEDSYAKMVLGGVFSAESITHWHLYSHVEKSATGREEWQFFLLPPPANTAPLTKSKTRRTHSTNCSACWRQSRLCRPIRPLKLSVMNLLPEPPIQTATLRCRPATSSATSCNGRRRTTST